MMKYCRYLMNCIRNDSFNDSANAFANLGDNIQALAMDSIYEKLGIKKSEIVYVKRDYIKEFDCESANILFYSEFSKTNIERRVCFPDNINVKGIVSAVFYDGIDLLSEHVPDIETILRKFPFIGCRDERSKLYLLSMGIQSYLMGCFTLCFEKRNTVPNKKKIFFVDTPKELEEFVPSYIREHSEYITHAVPIERYPVDEEENERLDNIARTLLKRYKDEATMVVTGRLHAALPCIAMGIPVILTCNNLDFRFEWVEKFIMPYQQTEYGEINWNPDVLDIEEVKSKILALFYNLLNNRDAEALTSIKWLDSYYSDRNRVKPYKVFREKILRIFDGDRDREFKYVIWGAGYHCRYAYDIISEVYPNSKLLAVVDKYKTGSFEDVEIIKGNHLKEFCFDHLFITTVPGTQDAIEWIEINNYKVGYTFITSQHKS